MSEVVKTERSVVVHEDPARDFVYLIYKEVSEDRFGNREKKGFMVRFTCEDLARLPLVSPGERFPLAELALPVGESRNDD